MYLKVWYLLKNWHFEPITGQIYIFALSKFDICYPHMLKGRIWTSQNLIFWTYSKSSLRVCVFRIWYCAPTGDKIHDFDFYKIDISKLKQIKTTALRFQSLKFVIHVSWRSRFQVVKIRNFEPIAKSNLQVCVFWVWSLLPTYAERDD